MPSRSARAVIYEDLTAIANLPNNPGEDSLGPRSVAVVHPNHSYIAVNACFESFPQGAFVSEIEGRIVGYVNAICLPSRIVLAPHSWSMVTQKGTGVSHNPAGKWLYVCRMLITVGAGHQSLGPELSPLLTTLKSLALRNRLDGVAVALPFPGKRERSGTTSFQRERLEEGAGQWGLAHYLSGAMGPAKSINIALKEGFDHHIALPNYVSRSDHFALMVWRNSKS